MKILHVSNIAQNSYINSIIFNRAGHDCDVMAFDLYHFACSPEWYEIFNVENLPNLTSNGFYPDFYELGQNLPVISQNVAQGPLFNAMAYLYLRRSGNSLANISFNALRYLRFKCTMLKTTTPFTIRWSQSEFHNALAKYDLPSEIYESILTGRLVDEVLEFIRIRLMRFAPSQAIIEVSVPFCLTPDHIIEAARPLDPILDSFVTTLRESGMMFALGLECERSEPYDLEKLSSIGSKAELAQFQAYGGLWRALHDEYDIVIYYADTSMYALTNGITEYCTLEHGTIRTIPFEDSLYGRLVACSFCKAKKVFITNTDYITNSRRLEFSQKQLVFLPHPFDERQAFEFKAQFKALDRKNGIVRFLCPARQDWRLRDPKMSKGNDLIFHAARALIDEGVSNFRLTCVAWGVDLQASKDLCFELGLADHVVWIEPLSKRALWEAMLSHDGVIDQFLISVVSGVTFESLSLGRRLITRDDGIENRVFFGEAPPILSAATAPEIATRMRQVLSDPDDELGIGSRCMAWIAKYHSAERIVEIQLRAFADILGNTDRAPTEAATNGTAE